MDIDWYLHLGWNPYPKCERVAIGGAPRFMRGIRLMFASDFHIRDITSDDYIASIAHMLSSQGADALLLGGDYGESENAARRLFDAIDIRKFPLGVFGVPGNNDTEAFCGDTDALAQAFPGRLLVNDAVKLKAGTGRLYIGGSDEIKHGSAYTRSPFPADTGGYAILISHYPCLPAAAGPRPRLMLSGHTHAGQIAFMGLTGYTFGMERQLVKAVNGLSNTGGMPVFVSSGIGMSRLPIRFCAAPRIHVIEFE